MADQQTLPMTRLALAAVALGVTACGLAPPDELAREVNSYYAAHATEENGACQRPEIASVTDRTELGGNLVEIRYTYFEPDDEGGTDWPQVFHKPAPCTGTGERQFTFEQTKLGLEVVEMSGPQRD
jgi:hypothetical protein